MGNKPSERIQYFLENEIPYGVPNALALAIVKYLDEQAEKSNAK